MKAFFLILLLVVALATSQAQTPMPSANDMNIVTFAGGWANTRNLNNSGMWGGLYLDKNLSKTSGVNSVYSLGIFSMVAWSNFQDNMAPYKADNRDVSLGLALGLYTKKFSASQPMFLGLNIGLKHSADDESSIPAGKFISSQRDWAFTLSLNWDLNKVPKPGELMWPRSQIQISWEKPFSTVKNATWENEVVHSEVWNREYIGLIWKQSILDYYFSPKIVLSPKLVLLYSHSSGNKLDRYGAGIELSLHKMQDDDFVSLFYHLKGDSQGRLNVGAFGLQINLMKLI